MSNLYKPNPSWRERRVTVPPNSVTEVSFSDTMPNYYYMNNQSGSDLYMSVKGIPTMDNYDLFVEAGGANIWGRGQGSDRIMVLNKSATSASFNLITYEDVFSPSVMGSSTTLNIQGGVSGFDGIIRGFNTPLPVGTNIIGKVDISSMPILPSGNNKIGQVDITSLPSGSNNIGKVDVNSVPVPLTHHYYEGAIGTSEVIWNLSSTCSEITFLTNDGDTDVFVSFIVSPITPIKGVNGLNGAIKLKAGESIQCKRRVDTVHLIRDSGSGVVRFMGV